MDPDLARSLIEGHEDVITPTAKAEAELFELIRCPVCGGQGADRAMLPPKVVTDEDGAPVVTRTPFSNASPTILAHAKCRTCRAEYDPHSGLIIAEPEEAAITSVQ